VALSTFRRTMIPQMLTRYGLYSDRGARARRSYEPHQTDT